MSVSIFHYELHKDATTAVTAGITNNNNHQQQRSVRISFKSKSKSKQQKKTCSSSSTTTTVKKLNLSELLAIFISNRRGVCSLKRPLRSMYSEFDNDDDENSCCMLGNNNNTPSSGNDSYDFTALNSDWASDWNDEHELDVTTLMEEFSESTSRDNFFSGSDGPCSIEEEQEESISRNNVEKQQQAPPAEEHESEERQQALTALGGAIQAISETAEYLTLVKDKELVLLCKTCNNNKKDDVAAAKQSIVTIMKHILHVEFQRTIMFQAMDALEQFVSELQKNVRSEIDHLIDNHQESIASIHESLGNAATLEHFEKTFQDWTLEDFYEEAVNRVQAATILKKKKKGAATKKKQQTATTKKQPTTTTKKQPLRKKL